MSTLWRRILVAMFCAAACVLVLGVRAALAAPPLPRVPKDVAELYLPQENEACAVGYGLYARLPEETRAKLQAGATSPVEASTLSRDQGRILAAWFNSARWGCGPPAEKLDAEGVARSSLALSGADGVVEFSLLSPQTKIRKSLPIACAPEKAEWVREGLPLVPHWYDAEGWAGGLIPPEAKPSRHAIQMQKNLFGSQGKDPKPAIEGMNRFQKFEWLVTRAVYRAYAQLSPDQLRALHRKGELRLPFRDLTAAQQDSLAEAVDTFRLGDSIGFGRALDWQRPPDALGRHYGITEVVFEYRREHPGVSIGAGIPGFDPCPEPFRRVFVTVDTTYPACPPELAYVKWLSTKTFRVAMPLELQRSLLAYDEKSGAWNAQWMGWKGNYEYVKEGAPPRPRFPEG